MKKSAGTSHPYVDPVPGAKFRGSLVYFFRRGRRPEAKGISNFRWMTFVPGFGWLAWIGFVLSRSML